MTRPDEKRFLSRIRRALGVFPARPAPPDLFAASPPAHGRRLLERIRNRTDAQLRSLFSRLAQAAGPLKMDVHPAADRQAAAAVIADLAAERSPEWSNRKTVAAWRHPLIESLDLPEALSVPVFFSEPDPALPPPEARLRLKERLAESLIGVTAAEFCLADTATLVLRTRPGQARSVSLLPSIHVAVVERRQLLADLGELLALIRWDPAQWAEGLTTCMTLVSGPSKTADIEATLVQGAHGPRELHLIVIEEGKRLDSESKI